jgi:hypothetical protein
MLNGGITYQILRGDSRSVVATISAILKKHPWYENQWWGQLEMLSEAERDQMLFMLATRWPDDIRIKDRAQHRGPWHYINFPFKQPSRR